MLEQVPERRAILSDLQNQMKQEIVGGSEKNLTKVEKNNQKVGQAKLQYNENIYVFSLFKRSLTIWIM